MSKTIKSSDVLDKEIIVCALLGYEGAVHRKMKGTEGTTAGAVYGAYAERIRAIYARLMSELKSHAK